MPITVDDVLRAKVIDTAIPATLRSVAPFLEEAQSILRNEPDAHRAHVAMYCIDHGFELVERFNLQLDEVGHSTVKEFAKVRTDLLTLFPYQDGSDHAMHMPDGTKKAGVRINPEEVLVAEATATMELGDDELKEGMKAAAARNFHTATVYYRVLESLVPNLTPTIHAKLQYCAMRTRQCSHLLENFVQEHFEANEKFTDVYDIHEKSKLGKGSYGSVFLCRHKRSGDEFACKVISLNRINSHYLRKLHLEIGIMKELTHPQIIQLHEVFFGSRTVYLVMELCSGGELFDYLQKNGQKGLSQRKVACCARDMLSSIRYLHENNVMHRDLKLENYLFDSDKDDASLKLIDFGLSKHFEAHENLHQVVGSAYYTAPEVLEGNYDQSCDLWSIGVIIYMLLCGSPPFYGDSSELIHEMINTKEADFGRKRFGHVSEIAIDFLRKLLVKEVPKRMTVDKALEHPFITSLDEDPAGNSTTNDAAVMTEVTNSLTQFLRQNQSKQVIMKIVAFSLTPSQINTLRDEFHTIDANRNGSLSMSELKQSIASFKGIDQKTVEKHSQQMGLSDDEEMNYNEFIAAAMCKRISIDEERLHLAFETMDTSHTGYITKQNVIDLLGQDCTEELIEEMFHDLDLRGDNRVDYKEFLVYWRGIMIKTHVTPLQRFRGAAKRVSLLLKMHSSKESQKKGSVSSVFLAAAKAAGGDSTIVAQGSGSPSSPIKHGIKNLHIADSKIGSDVDDDSNTNGKGAEDMKDKKEEEEEEEEEKKVDTETKANDPFGFGWW